MKNCYKQHFVNQEYFLSGDPAMQNINERDSLKVIRDQILFKYDDVTKSLLDEEYFFKSRDQPEQTVAEDDSLIIFFKLVSLKDERLVPLGHLVQSMNQELDLDFIMNKIPVYAVAGGMVILVEHTSLKCIIDSKDDTSVIK